MEEEMRTRSEEAPWTHTVQQGILRLLTKAQLKMWYYSSDGFSGNESSALTCKQEELTEGTQLTKLENLSKETEVPPLGLKFPELFPLLPTGVSFPP